MNDKNNLAKLIVSGDKANHKIAAIMLTNYTAVEFLEALQEVAKLYTASMPPNVHSMDGQVPLAPNLRFNFHLRSIYKRTFDFDFIIRKKESWSRFALFVAKDLTIAHDDCSLYTANQVLGYLQQYYKNSQ